MKMTILSALTQGSGPPASAGQGDFGEGKANFFAEVFSARDVEASAAGGVLEAGGTPIDGPEPDADSTALPPGGLAEDAPVPVAGAVTEVSVLPAKTPSMSEDGTSVHDGVVDTGSVEEGVPTLKVKGSRSSQIGNANPSHTSAPIGETAQEVTGAPVTCPNAQSDAKAQPTESATKPFAAKSISVTQGSVSAAGLDEGNIPTKHSKIQMGEFQKVQTASHDGASISFRTPSNTAETRTGDWTDPKSVSPSEGQYMLNVADGKSVPVTDESQSLAGAAEIDVLLANKPVAPLSTLERHLQGRAAIMPAQDARQDMAAAPLTLTPKIGPLFVKDTPRFADLTGMTASLARPVLVTDKPDMPVLISATPLNLREAVKSGANAKSGIFNTVDALHDDTPFGNGTTTSTATHMTAPVRTEHAAHAMQQVGEHVRNSSGNKIEIALCPLELGRVRIVLSPSEAGLSVSVLADRPETLDLMRRHIDDLGETLSDMGYEDIAFSFGQNEQTSGDETFNGDDRQTPDMSGILDTATVPSPTLLPQLSVAHADGIDMRF